MNILLMPYAKPLPNGEKNPKDYPYWEKLVTLMKQAGHTLIQVGVEGEKQLVDDFRKNLPFDKVAELILECDIWLSVDSFGQHLAWDLGKPGIVLFSQSDPNIFGHTENINVLKDRKYLRSNQFWLWTQTTYDINAYVQPQEVFQKL